MKIEFRDFIYLSEKEQIDILEIRNSSYVRENMINDTIIEKEAHLSWIKSLKIDENNRYFVVLLDDIVVGSLYFNINNKDECFWGIYLKKGFSPIFSTLSAYIFIEFLFNKKLKEVFALVKNQNQNAIKFNKNFGFKSFKEDEEFIYLKLSKEDWENQNNSKLLKPIKRYLDKIEFIFKDKRW